MGTTFNSFDSPEADPFVNDINIVMKETKQYIRFPLKWTSKAKKSKRALDEASQRVNQVVDDIIRKRRNKETAAPGNMPDLLDLMLNGVDKSTGQSLSDENIRYQIITFLIAGHDTTASSMCFFFDFIIADPRVEAKLIKEIEEVVGTGDVRYEHLNKLKYLSYCQNEALRLQPPARAVIKRAKCDGHLGKYRVKKGQGFTVAFQALQLDKATWGPDADKFVPERWEKGALNPFAYLPFSTGPRGCIGMEFSLVEQKIAIVKLLQNFCFRRPPGEFGLQLENRLFVGPINYTTQVFERPALECRGSLHDGMARRTPGLEEMSQLTWQAATESVGHKTPLLVLYGSNGGSTQDLAQRTAAKAQELGFAVKLASLDEFTDVSEIIALTSYVLVCCATYNGCPPDNGASFLKTLQNIRSRHEKPLQGVKFAVFGCGNTQWSTSYQVVPIAVDEGLEMSGCQRILPRHEGDSAGDMEKAFESWLDVLWPALSSASNVKLEKKKADKISLSMPQVDILPSDHKSTALVLDYEGGAKQLRMVENLELTHGSSSRSVRHIEFVLEAGTSYTVGDHLAIYPENDPELVSQLMACLGLQSSTVVRIGADPLVNQEERIVRLYDWLLRAVDLSKGSSAQAISHLASRAKLHLDQVTLQTLSATSQAQRVQMPLLELLLKYTSIELTLGEVLALLPPMKPRLYSISSSPRATPNRLSVTVGVLSVVTGSGREHRGVCSNFLASQNVGAQVWATIKDTRSSFRLPPPATPMIMVGPGTGIAPLRGFLQDLQQKRRDGVATGSVHLFFGCRAPSEFLYEQELRQFQADGTLTKLHVAFSRTEEKQYVQHLMHLHASELWPILKDGGHVFVCGDASRMAPEFRDAISFVVKSGTTMDEKGCLNFVQHMSANHEGKRYHEDVWAGNA
jgi:cytochrome P450/NADPH-cytochrome P450 reductase